ncbi:U3 small nucleolar RNA-associated protein 15 homolog [Halyomorpha halys]|uniref:U3 small nucleolar RNA-associated protein 15 homolog n=1 Tax=Halyomorpha halys TaxID=286706 RepID=UPI0006D4D5AA|nr:U3 small nucleolar RNA-associated protein 15 homolog [Halyomorpha halys]
MSIFKKTNVKIFAKPTQKVTPDTSYWRQLGAPVLLKEFGPIDYIDFSPIEPHCFAVSSSAKVQIYNPVTKLVHKTLSKFVQNAYGGSFRSDGNLLCAGSEDSNVKLFDVNSKSLLRVFKGHKSGVHRCYFTSDNRGIASFSDDKTVKLWDIASESETIEFSSHEDYVRAGAISPVSPTIVLSGSYDRKVRLFDSRTNAEAVFTLDHGHPVESVLFLPSGGIFISAGGTEIRVWDALAGGRLLARVSQHHKTITCLGLASSGSRLVSGSLDRHVKIYDVSTYKAVYNLDYPNAILSLGVSPDDETVAVGTVDGIVSVKRRDIEKNNNQKVKPKKKTKGSYRYFSDRFTPTDVVVKQENKQLQSKYDNCLRKFQYSKSLDSVLVPYVTNKSPHVTVSLLQELIRRKGLENALVSREDKSIAVLIRFLLRNIGDYRFSATLIDVANILLDVYDKRLDSASIEVLELLKKLAKRIKEEEELTLELASLGGAIRMILAASTVSEKPEKCSLPPLTPSNSAQKNIVVNVS